MPRGCWSVVVAIVLSLGGLGCAVSSDAGQGDGSESVESLPSASEASESSIATALSIPVERDAAAICRQWFCEARGPGPAECYGFGSGSSLGRCRAAALVDCTNRCGRFCEITSEDCVLWE